MRICCKPSQAFALFAAYRDKRNGVRELHGLSLGMISRDAARTKVEAFVNKPDPYWPDRPRVVVQDDVTLERPYGWVFFYDVPGHVVAGNAPVLVTRDDGGLHVLGTALPVEAYLASFERTGDPHRDAAP